MTGRGRTQRDTPVTMVVLALVTVLIWLFAESQTLSRVEVETVVTLSAPEGLSRVAHWADGRGPGTVLLTLEGPRGEIDSAALRLRREGVTLTVGADGGPGTDPREYTLDMREAVRRSAGSLLGSVAVQSAEPASRVVDVDELITLDEVTVEFDSTGLDLAEPAVIEPPTVRVTGPSKVLGPGVGVRATLDRAAAAALRPGASQRLDARLEVTGLAAGDRTEVVVTPNRCVVRLSVRSRVRTLDVASAPVQVLGLPTDLARWRVTPGQQFVDGLTITGPSDLVAKIESRELSVVAVIRLTSDELQRRVTEKTPTFALLSADGVVPVPASVQITGPTAAVPLVIEPATPVTTDPNAG